MTDQANRPTLIWDSGTAYEFVVSLFVIHSPEHNGVRASWAAGIRSRIPAAERKFLDDVIHFINFPIGWVYRLPKPKDAITALWTLKQTPPEKRAAAILDIEHWEDSDICTKFLEIAERRSWDQDDLAALIKIMEEKGDHENNGEIISRFLSWWVRPKEFGEMLLSAYQAYYQAFFEEEEKRVAPILQAGLERAQQLAERMSVSELIVELSQGVHYDEITTKELIIAPAYWTTPLVVLDRISPDQMIFLFGARPASMSALPGELVPEGLLRALKALADPTRLKILYYISQEDVTPSELARRLHLRAPTVTHHLNDLRLAGLVNLTFRGQEKLYRSRVEAIQSTFTTLDNFLKNPPGENSG